MSASKNGKIAGIVVYKPTSKVTEEIRTKSKYSCYYEQILGNVVCKYKRHQKQTSGMSTEAKPRVCEKEQLT